MSRILSVRLFKSPTAIMNPFIKLALESVLNQIFLISTGLWSDDTASQTTFDSCFWSTAEKLLVGCDPNSKQLVNANSPILGIPVALFRLAMSVKQFYQGTLRPLEVALSRLNDELESWEVLVRDPQLANVWTRHASTSSKYRCFQDVAALMILVISLLFEQVLRGKTANRFPLKAANNSWQITMAREVLQRNRQEEKWSLCFIGTWPVYTLGFLMSDDADIQLVKDDLDRRWHRTKFSQAQRYRKDLEQFPQRVTLFNSEACPIVASLHQPLNNCVYNRFDDRGHAQRMLEAIVRRGA